MLDSEWTARPFLFKFYRLFTMKVVPHLNGTIRMRPVAVAGCGFALLAGGCREDVAADYEDRPEGAVVAVATEVSPAVLALEELIDPAALDALDGRRAARRVFRRIFYQLEEARRNGEVPEELIEAAQERLGMTNTARADAVRDSLLRSLEILGDLGCLDDAGMAKLRMGSAPMITLGEHVGEIASVDLIIPRSVCDEVEEKLFNLEFVPEPVSRERGNRVSRRQIRLARTWYARGVLSREGMDKVLAAETSD